MLHANVESGANSGHKMTLCL